MLLITAMTCIVRLGGAVRGVNSFGSAGNCRSLGHGVYAGLGERHCKKRKRKRRTERHFQQDSDPTCSSHATFELWFQHFVKRIDLQPTRHKRL